MLSCCLFLSGRKQRKCCMLLAAQPLMQLRVWGYKVLLCKSKLIFAEITIQDMLTSFLRRRPVEVSSVVLSFPALKDLSLASITSDICMVFTELLLGLNIYRALIECQFTWEMFLNHSIKKVFQLEKSSGHHAFQGTVYSATFGACRRSLHQNCHSSLHCVRNVLVLFWTRHTLLSCLQTSTQLYG